MSKENKIEKCTLSINFDKEGFLKAVKETYKKHYPKDDALVEKEEDVAKFLVKHINLSDFITTEIKKDDKS